MGSKAAAAGAGKDKTVASKPGAIGSGVGASRGLDPAAQAVLVGVTRSGKKGKTVTVVDGLDPGGPDAAKELKRAKEAYMKAQRAKSADPPGKKQ